MGLREAFLGAVLGQEAPGDLAAQNLEPGPAALASPQSLLEMQNHALTSNPLNQNHHFNKMLVAHRHVKVWEVLVYILPLQDSLGHVFRCIRSTDPLCYSPASLPSPLLLKASYGSPLPSGSSPSVLVWHNRRFATGPKLTSTHPHGHSPQLQAARYSCLIAFAPATPSPA